MENLGEEQRQIWKQSSSLNLKVFAFSSGPEI